MGSGDVWDGAKDGAQRDPQEDSQQDASGDGIDKTFTEALAMIAALPLSPAETAEAVRRPLTGHREDKP